MFAKISGDSALLCPTISLVSNFGGLYFSTSKSTPYFFFLLLFYPPNSTLGCEAWTISLKSSYLCWAACIEYISFFPSFSKIFLFLTSVTSDFFFVIWLSSGRSKSFNDECSSELDENLYLLWTSRITFPLLDGFISFFGGKISARPFFTISRKGPGTSFVLGSKGSWRWCYPTCSALCS